MNLADVPRMWPYEPSNSPLPLPPKPVVFTQQRLHWFNAEKIGAKSMSQDEIKSSVAGWKTDSGMTVDAILPSRYDEAVMEVEEPSCLQQVRTVVAKPAAAGPLHERGQESVPDL